MEFEFAKYTDITELYKKHSTALNEGDGYIKFFICLDVEFQGTKGEWLLHESYVLEKKMICIASTKNMSPIRNNYPLVCAISEVSGYNEEDKANAKLIASIRICREIYRKRGASDK